MTKLAAIAPLLAAASAAATIGGTVLSARNQSRQQKKQNQANQRWSDFQQQQQRRFGNLEDERRQGAINQQRQALQAQDIGNRQAVVDTETERLAEAFGGAQPQLDRTAGDLLLSGQSSGDENFQNELGKRLSQATTEAKSRIQALARASAYGGSSGGLGTVEGINQVQAAGDIGLINDARRGNTATLQRYQQITPEQIQAEPSLLADLLTGAGQIGVGYFGGMKAPVPDVSSVPGPHR